MSDKVFWFSLLLVAGFVAPEGMTRRRWTLSNIAVTGSLPTADSCMMAVLGFLVFVIVLAFSRYGNIKLGKTTKTDYSYWSWFAIFAAGLGSVSSFWRDEPLHHFSQPPEQISPLRGVSRLCDAVLLFHWDHGWAVYALWLWDRYFSFRRRMPPSSVPASSLLGERIYPGQAI